MRLGKTDAPTFFDLFAQQASGLVTATSLLASILGASPAERVAIRDQLHDVEHSGDELNHTITRRINQTFVTPLDREDLGQLASNLDDCMDFIDEAADLFVVYRIEEIPEPISALLSDQVDILARCAEQTNEAIPSLKSPLDLRDYWVEINRLENEGDLAYRRTLTTIFDSGLDPVTIIKLKDIVEVLEKACDAYEDLANGIEAIAVKES
ncbi:DUF47 family protein [Actinomyces sp. B33]|uniref:DUF47 domain-containing protein n=1 Tax=Actinomyces sp. B33 TaxID=2942131 RepID=UPI002340675E|nr:DUF47 family protein [Actinomyces sp. B33]MDC4232305.1 DUF47 family protein [Actinomyces sp. B33]